KREGFPSVDDQVRLAGLRFGDPEAVAGGPADEPLALLLDGHVPVPPGVSARPRTAVSGRVGGEAEGPLLSVLKRLEEVVVRSGVPRLRGRPAGLLHQVGQIRLVGAGDVEDGARGSGVVHAPEHSWALPTGRRCGETS